jgi:hypothetical protein
MTLKHPRVLPALSEFGILYPITTAPPDLAPAHNLTYCGNCGLIVAFVAFVAFVALWHCGICGICGLCGLTVERRLWNRLYVITIE